MKNLLLILLSFTSVVMADTKSVLKRIPASYDYVLCLRFPELFKNEKLKKRLEDNKAYVKARDNMEKKLGLAESDLLSFYIAGVAAQYQKIQHSGQVNAQKLETAAFMELARPLDVEKLKAEFGQSFSGSKEVNGVTCIEFKAEKMKSAKLAFLSPTLVMICPDHQLTELIKLNPDESMLANADSERLLTTNGFGGVLSFVHWGEVGEVHPMTPWMKDYNGGTINVFYDEAKGMEVECTLSFNKLASVKSASLLIGMGLSFMDMKPELAQLKRLIDFKVHDRNLLVDVKISPGMMTEIEGMLKNLGKKRGKK